MGGSGTTTTTTSAVKDVMDLFGGLTKAAEAVKTIETEKISIIKPRRDLIEPWEPMFADGVTSKGSSGSIITLGMIGDAFDDGENIHLVGPSGCGKTTIARALLDIKNADTRAGNKEIWARNEELLKAHPELTPDDLEPYDALPYPMKHYSSHEGTRSEDLVGKIKLIHGQDGNRQVTEVLGAITDAWINGKTLVWEEFDFTPPSILGEAHLFMDGSSQEAELYLNEPRTIYKHPGFRCIGTSNTRGAGEGAMEFAGTQPLNAAFMNRFNYTVNITWLPEAVEAKLLRAKVGITGKNVEKMIKIANKMRKLYDEEQVERPISTRALLAWAREIKRGGARIGKSAFGRMTDSELWHKVAAPAADPTILEGLSDPSSRDALSDAIKLY
jgi:MoxR-like ATPase